MSFISSASPNKGFLTVSINNKENIVCSEAPNDKVKNIVCKQLGYWKTQEQSSTVSSSNLEKFSGRIDCQGDEATLSQCVTSISTPTTTCNKQSYITCKYTKEICCSRRGYRRAKKEEEKDEYVNK